MGNKLDLDAKICYSCDGFPIEMIMKELKGKKNFPKLPKEREIEKKYKEWGTKVILMKKLKLGSFGNTLEGMDPNVTLEI